MTAIQRALFNLFVLFIFFTLKLLDLAAFISNTSRKWSFEQRKDNLWPAHEYAQYMSIIGLSDKTLFRRNPTPADVQAATLEIERHKAAIAGLQDRIFSLLSEVQALRKEQKEHHDQITICKGVTTLARRIPAELLSDIFEHCVEDEWYRAPLVVSQVCSAWRVAARAPRVWSHIYINCNAVNFVGRTQYWLSKAAEAPLHITFAASYRTDAEEMEHVMKLLLSHVAHWRSLTFNSIPLEELHSIFDLCSSKAPRNLQSISIDTQVEFLEDIDATDGDYFHLEDIFREDNAPKLTTIKYVCNALPPEPIFPSHIQTLILDTTNSPRQRPLSAEGYMTVLSNLTQLQSLTIHLPLISPHRFIQSTDPTMLISLPSLNYLTVYGLDDLNGLLGYFNVPSLRALRLRAPEERLSSSNDIDTSLRALLANSSPPLEILELHDVDLLPETFTACFLQLTELRVLQLHNSHIDDRTLSLLQRSHGHCPRLTQLDLRWCQNFQGDTLVEVVRSRNVVDGTRLHAGGQACSANSAAIDEVTVINCSLVKEKDVLDLARMTVCRVILRDTDDYCRSRGCCGNTKYTQRLHFRHTTNLSPEERASMHLIM